MATADVDAIEKCEKGFEKLQTAECKSLLKKYLTRETLDQLKVRTTDFGSTLYDVIQSGVQNLDSHVGIYAPDVQAYKVFALLFDPVIEDYHHGFKSEDKHPAPYWGNLEDFGTLDDEDKYIISTRIRIGRSIEQFPLNPKMTEQHYQEIEKLVKDILSELDGELEGSFHSLSNMSQEVKQQLIDDHFLFKEGDRFLEAANANRFWPTGRGIFHNNSKTFLVWCNEEDHLRIISMENGSNVKSVYSRLVNAVQLIQQKIPFSNDERLGYLTFCPTNLGTTLRASVLIKIPNLLNNKDILKEATDRYKLQVRGFRGENSGTEDGIADVSNKRRLGLTEYEAVKEMYDGVKEIISLEKCLSDST